MWMREKNCSVKTNYIRTNVGQVRELIRMQSLILHKMLTFTGPLSLSRFGENWNVVVTNEFHRI